MSDLDAQDAKLVTLARSARGRVGAAEGAAVRDETGRSYTGATVALPSLGISAVGLAVATAAASGARSLEAAVLVTSAGAINAEDLAAIKDLGGVDTPVMVCNARGEVVGSFGG